ncbi:hypothetical protein EV189_2210 [Motilibacter rhizosphaerae]|uniref:Phosphodiesterase n=1 Tax=Motilibacter rhizosphaerae TaxID=598652 RepID=A0A4Q7NNH4_9ACTN|nr:phosphodiesterase [Motilibacter rhizosphaerae]RZS86794.1 hypothetical protein EV189_2210 [Motilibacter rhizosphaerae]
MALTQLGSAVGSALARVSVLRGGRPMHPSGDTYVAVLDRLPLAQPWGVAWLDATGSAPAVVRLSRSVGLPGPVPDVLGLAVRVPGAGGPVDLLLATAGLGALSRHLLAPRRDTAGAYSSLASYGSPQGRVTLAAVAEDQTPTSFVLAAALGRGPFEPYAVLRLGALLAADEDPADAYDAVRHAPPGLTADGAMSRFRAPAYARVREQRDARLEWRVPQSPIAP